MNEMLIRVSEQGAGQWVAEVQGTRFLASGHTVRAAIEALLAKLERIGAVVLYGGSE
jgi:hypothetical protein